MEGYAANGGGRKMDVTTSNTCGKIITDSMEAESIAK